RAPRAGLHAELERRDAELLRNELIDGHPAARHARSAVRGEHPAHPRLVVVEADEVDAVADEDVHLDRCERLEDRSRAEREARLGAGRSPEFVDRPVRAEEEDDPLRGRRISGARDGRGERAREERRAEAAPELTSTECAHRLFSPNAWRERLKACPRMWTA